jgi:hypothetical protein
MAKRKTNTGRPNQAPTEQSEHQADVVTVPGDSLATPLITSDPAKRQLLLDIQGDWPTISNPRAILTSDNWLKKSPGVIHWETETLRAFKNLSSVTKGKEEDVKYRIHAKWARREKRRESHKRIGQGWSAKEPNLRQDLVSIIWDLDEEDEFEVEMQRKRVEEAREHAANERKKVSTLLRNTRERSITLKGGPEKESNGNAPNSRDLSEHVGSPTFITETPNVDGLSITEDVADPQCSDDEEPFYSDLPGIKMKLTDYWALPGNTCQDAIPANLRSSNWGGKLPGAAIPIEDWSCVKKINDKNQPYRDVKGVILKELCKLARTTKNRHDEVKTFWGESLRSRNRLERGVRITEIDKAYAHFNGRPIEFEDEMEGEAAKNQEAEATKDQDEEAMKDQNEEREKEHDGDDDEMDLDDPTPPPRQDKGKGQATDLVDLTTDATESQPGSVAKSKVAKTRKPRTQAGRKLSRAELSDAIEDTQHNLNIAIDKERRADSDWEVQRNRVGLVDGNVKSLSIEGWNARLAQSLAKKEALAAREVIDTERHNVRLLQRQLAALAEEERDG